MRIKELKKSSPTLRTPSPLTWQEIKVASFFCLSFWQATALLMTDIPGAARKDLQLLTN
jgi:hypothetical protein